MATRSIRRAIVMGIAAVLLFAPSVSADTCCVDLPVGLDPTAARSGDIVLLTGIECREADDDGPLPLLLGTFLLLPTDYGVSRDSHATSGDGPPALPPTEEWLTFTSVDPEDVGLTAPGDATITVPELPDGRYQLWWWCENGPELGGAIHYSTGPRLTVGTPPETSTDATVAAGAPDRSPGSGWPVGLSVAIGGVAFLLLRRWLVVRPTRR